MGEELEIVNAEIEKLEKEKEDRDIVLYALINLPKHSPEIQNLKTSKNQADEGNVLDFFSPSRGVKTLDTHNKIPPEKKESFDYCLNDYKHRHYWERIGIWRDSYILYKCSQCNKCKLHIIKFLTPSVEEIKW